MDLEGFNGPWNHSVTETFFEMANSANETYGDIGEELINTTSSSWTLSCRCFSPENLNKMWATLRNRLIEKTMSPIVITVLLSIYWLLGTLGNALVIYVFGKKIKQRTSARCFIITLAVLDFLVCLLVIPGELFDLWFFPFGADFVCKGYEWMRQSMIPVTAFILGAIAFDRYFLICKAPATIITPRIAKIIIAALVVIGASMAILPTLAFSVYVQRGPTCNKLCYYGQCKTNYHLIGPHMVSHYFSLLTTMYAIVTVTISILYALVFVAVRRRSQRWGHNRLSVARQVVSYHVSKCDNSTVTTNIRTKTRPSKTEQCDDLINGNDPQTKLIPEDHHKETNKYEPEANGKLKPTSNNKVAMTIELAEDEEGYCDDDSIGTKLSSLADNTTETQPTTPLTVDPKDTEQDTANSEDASHTRHRSSPEVKTAQILCLVTACFVLAYLPLFLVYYLNIQDSRQVHPLHNKNVGMALLYVIHYTNHVVNPFIYGFMNRHFKSEVKKMITACRNRRARF